MQRLGGLVRGVFVEVLWDLQLTLEDKRRNDTTKHNRVWWRGKTIVVEIRTCGSCRLKVRYDAGNDFTSQTL